MEDSPQTRSAARQFADSPPERARTFRIQRFRRPAPWTANKVLNVFADELILPDEAMANQDDRPHGCRVAWCDEQGKVLLGEEVFPLQAGFEGELLASAFPAVRRIRGRLEIWLDQEFALERGPRLVEAWSSERPFWSWEALDPQSPVAPGPAAAPRYRGQAPSGTDDLVRTASEAGATIEREEGGWKLTFQRTMPLFVRVLFGGLLLLFAAFAWWFLLVALLFRAARDVISGLVKKIILGFSEKTELVVGRDDITFRAESSEETVPWSTIEAVSLSPSDSVLPGTGHAALRLITMSGAMVLPVFGQNKPRLALQRALKYLLSQELEQRRLGTA